jgi:uncharacterized protein YjbI with pentapeptide repeats
MYPAPLHTQPPPWPQGLSPRRAPVTPRVRASPGADPLPLEHHISSLLDSSARGIVNLFGPAGSGKTAALNHLAAVFGPRQDLRFADNRYPAWVDVAADRGLVVFASREKRHESVHAFEMCPWSQDEIIEYLLATHRDRCAEVMQRILGDADRDSLPGLPELWKPLLDLLAADPRVQTCGTALRKLLHTYASDAAARAVLASFCLGLVTEMESEADVDRLVNDVPEALRLTRYRPVQVFLAAEAIANDLQAHRPCSYLKSVLGARDLLRETGVLLAARPAAQHRLEYLLVAPDRDLHPSAASLLLAADPFWRPPEGSAPHLAGAKLQRVQWKDIPLWGINLASADLSEASLPNAQLHDADLYQAHLRGAKLTHALLAHAHVAEADLCGADLVGARGDWADFSAAKLVRACLVKAKLKHAAFRGADLSNACLAEADLSHARLEDATIDGASFTGCCLDHASLGAVPLRRAYFDGATFRGANLVGADLEGMGLPEADFRGANLVGALLTGASLPGARFAGADLRRAGLADVDWENADLTDADLRGATFHLGSTRSGLVPGGIPSEGTRTGFYTDDYDEHRHRPPEEIRRANLRGANLVGARVEGTDFYLVDLRDAHYTDDQREHFRRCRAILSE